MGSPPKRVGQAALRVPLSARPPRAASPGWALLSFGKSSKFPSVGTFPAPDCVPYPPTGSRFHSPSPLPMPLSRPLPLLGRALALTLGFPQTQAQTALYQEDFAGEEAKAGSEPRRTSQASPGRSTPATAPSPTTTIISRSSRPAATRSSKPGMSTPITPTAKNS